MIFLPLPSITFVLGYQGLTNLYDFLVLLIVIALWLFCQLFDAGSSYFLPSPSLFRIFISCPMIPRFFFTVEYVFLRFSSVFTVVEYLFGDPCLLCSVISSKDLICIFGHSSGKLIVHFIIYVFQEHHRCKSTTKWCLWPVGSLVSLYHIEHTYIFAFTFSWQFDIHCYHD